MPVACQIRSMALSDLPQVLDLEQRAHQHPWPAAIFQQELENEVSAIDLLLFEDRLAGYIVSWLVAGELEIQNVVTAPEYRRKGLARLLLEAVIGRAVRQGISRVLLEVRAGNRPAIALYERLGFKINGQRSKYYSNGETAVLMCLDDFSDFNID